MRLEQLEPEIRDHVRRMVTNAKPKSGFFGSSSASVDVSEAEVNVCRCGEAWQEARGLAHS